MRGWWGRKILNRKIKFFHPFRKRTSSRRRTVAEEARAWDSFSLVIDAHERSQQWNVILIFPRRGPMRECSLHFPRRRNYREGKGGGSRLAGPASLLLSRSTKRSIKNSRYTNALDIFFSFHTTLITLTLRTQVHTLSHTGFGKSPFTHERVIQLIKEMIATFDRGKKIGVKIHKI